MSHLRTVTVSVIGVSGKDSVKGAQGVGKSTICNRFVRGDYDDFIPEHSSVLSQTDFSGSPVINNDHWLYWGDRAIECDDSGCKTNIRVIEQTEFLDDETFEPLAGPSTSEGYPKRACRVKLESRDKLMYIQKEQLGLEAEFPQQVLPDGKCQVDCFVFVFDPSRTPGRPFERQLSHATPILLAALKSKKPLVIAVSKCDIQDEEGRKSLQTLLSKKDFKGSHFAVVETSSLMNVNIEELFISAVNLVSKGKTRLKTVPFGEAAKIIFEHNREVKVAYYRLLNGVLPISSWPVQRLSWSSLMLKLDIDRHPDYCTFVRTYGSMAARKAYDQHVNDAREHWMAARLRALLPNLPRVFSALLDRSQVPELSWNDAKMTILSHALVDDYFQPLGVLGRQLDPLSPDVLYDEKRGDNRIPAEILLRQEARLAYEDYQQSVEAEFRKERLEEDFEFLLSETTQVTPGKPLHDVCLFLQGCSAYDSLAPSQAALVYDRFQNDLVLKAQMEFSECLLENVELFLEMLNFRGSSPMPSSGDSSFALGEEDVNRLNDFLQDDFRYRQLSRLCELRLNMMYQFAAFLAMPIASRCPAKTRCADLVLHDALMQYFQRPKSSNAGVPDHFIDVTVHGEIGLVAQFITDMNCLLRNTAYKCSSGSAIIRCYGEEEEGDEGETARQPRTRLYLLDTPQSIEDARVRVEGCGSRSQLCPLPPVYVLVCDPGQYDLLPYMHQKGAMLADSTGGIFIGAGSAGSEETASESHSSDCSSIFGRDQLLRVCDTLCSSQLDRRKCDMRTQVSVLCGDPYATDTLLAALFPIGEGRIRTVINTSLLSAGMLPVDVSLPTSATCRIDTNFRAYHTWLSCRPITSIHGHILVYSARRVASMAHARAAVARILDEGCETVSGKAILLVAVADNGESHDEETNLLLTEGSELAVSIGAQFLVVTPNSESGEVTNSFIEYLDRLKGMVSAFNSDPMDRSKRESDGYATLSEFRNLRVSAAEEPRTYSAYKTSLSAGTLLSDSSASRSSTLSVASAVVRPDSAPGIGPAHSGSQGSGYGPSWRPRRRAAPPSSIRLPPICRQMEAAPLATPEAIEIVPEYSVVQDALTDDDHIYATLDFASPVRDDRLSQSGSEKSDESKKEKKRPLRSRIFSSNSHSTEPCSSASPSGYSHPSSADNYSSPSRLNPAKYPPTPFLMRSSVIQPVTQKSVTQPVTQKSGKPVVAPKPSYLQPQQPFSTRSATMDLIKLVNTPQAVKARSAARVPAGKIGAGLPGLRQSLSAESLADLMNAKKRKTRDFGGAKFVRKVASSFRFKKAPEEAERKSAEREGTSISVPPQGSRSLPQSPQVERRAVGKKYGSLASGEKTSSAFSWLPSRSPKRTTKTVAAETSSGVVSPTDTLESLANSGQNGIPLFLCKCCEFIETNGGLDLEGLYRVPGNQAQLMELEKAYKISSTFDLCRLDLPIHVVATAVKNFFSCLPEPLIPFDTHFDLIASLEKEDVCGSLSVALARLPHSNREVLRYFTQHLHKVASAPATAMDVHNLSKVWFPTFFRPNFDNFEEMSNGMAKFQRALEVMLTFSDQLFP